MDNPASIPGPLSLNQREELVNLEESSVLPLNSFSTAFEASRVVKQNQGKLYGASIYNQNAAARFVLLFDAVALPANGTAARATYTIGAAAMLGLYFGSVGRSFEQGILFALSTTAGTLTVAGSDMWVDAQYV